MIEAPSPCFRPPHRFTKRSVATDEWRNAHSVLTTDRNKDHRHEQRERERERDIYIQRFRILSHAVYRFSCAASLASMYNIRVLMNSCLSQCPVTRHVLKLADLSFILGHIPHSSLITEAAAAMPKHSCAHRLRRIYTS